MRHIEQNEGLDIFTETLQISESLYGSLDRSPHLRVSYVDFRGGPHALRKGRPYTSRELAGKTETILFRGDELSMYVKDRIHTLQLGAYANDRDIQICALSKIVSLLDEGINADEILIMAAVTRKTNSHQPFRSEDIFDGEMR